MMRWCRAIPPAGCLLLPLLLGLWLHAVPVAAAVPEPLSEDEVKASYVYNFIKYVEWPQPYRDPANLTVCTVGRSPLYELLESLDGRSVKSRRLVVHAHVRGDDLKDCDVAFVKGATVPPVVPVSPVLTVGDGKGFTASGGMIGFVHIGDKIRFEINNHSAMRARLKISSHLLRLAVSVQY